MRSLFCLFVGAWGAATIVEATELQTGGQGRTPATETKLVAHAQDDRVPLELVYVSSTRSRWARSSGLIRFKVVGPDRLQLGSVNRQLELVQGFGGRWMLTREPLFPIKHEEWVTAKLKQREWLLTLRVYGAEPDCQALEQLTVKLHYKRLGTRRPYQEAVFTFDEVPF